MVGVTHVVRFILLQNTQESYTVWIYSYRYLSISKPIRTNIHQLKLSIHRYLPYIQISWPCTCIIIDGDKQPSGIHCDAYLLGNTDYDLMKSTKHDPWWQTYRYNLYTSLTTVNIKKYDLVLTNGNLLHPSSFRDGYGHNSNFPIIWCKERKLFRYCYLAAALLPLKQWSLICGAPAVAKLQLRACWVL